MLVGGDDVSNDVSSIFHMVSMFVYIHTCFRFALIGGNLTAQSRWCHRGILRQNSSSRDMVASALSFSCPPGGVLGISSDGDDRRFFWGFEIFDSGIFLGTKIWQEFFGVA